MFRKTWLFLFLTLCFCASAHAGSLYLALSDPEYPGCGQVSINGAFGSDAGLGARMDFDWGDGTRGQTWFPARHVYATNGEYTVTATVSAEGAASVARTVKVTIADAGQGDCSFVELSLATPAYNCCGGVSVGGGVVTSVGSVTRVVWDWGDGDSGESHFPAEHRYATNGSYTVRVTACAAVGRPRVRTTAVAVTNAEMASCANMVRVYPSEVYLRRGWTNETLGVDVRRLDGWPVPVSSHQIHYISSRPDLVQVTPEGRVTGTGFGEARVDVMIDGQPWGASVKIHLGEVVLEPCILLLTTKSGAPGQVGLRASNADGSSINLAGRQVVFTGGNEVASVSPSGLVTPLRPPASFLESPYINASLDGIAVGNACLVRVTSSDLGLTMRDHQGRFTTLRFADHVGTYPYATLTTRLQAVQVADALYQLQSRLTGGAPGRGTRQYLAMDPGYDADGTVPCGLSGNPIRLGTGVDNLRSCFAGADWIQWGVWGHELAHNFLFQRSFGDFVSGLANPVAYSEGMATALSVSCFEHLTAEPERFGLASATVASFSDVWWHPLLPINVRTVHYQALTNYEANPNYAAGFNGDICDAIMLKLEEEYGPSFMFRLMSVFYPADESFMSYDMEVQRLTFWVAACSAAARADLRPRFRDKWGYPIDEAFYAEIMPLVQRRAAQRDPLIKQVAVSSNAITLTSSAIAGTRYVLQCSTNLTDWSTLRTLDADGTPWSIAKS
ncbi:MAG: PKD domain-containing protein [Verrucomicrobia bacterium]|nr:MAG: PKD domain-containing protein [Verrucomicrobiota bacterium]